MNDEKDKKNEITNEVRQQYAKAFLKFGIDKKSLFWPKGRQEIRYQTHLSAIESLTLTHPREFTIIDYGCGFSDLYSYIKKYDIPIFKYTGVDILNHFLEISKKRFPDNEYYDREFFVETKEIEADIVCAIGTFSMRYVANWDYNYHFVLSEIDSLWEKTKIFLSLDFMTDKVDFMQLNSFHLDPTKLLSDLTFLLNPKRIEIIESKIPFEFLVQIWK